MSEEFNKPEEVKSEEIKTVEVGMEQVKPEEVKVEGIKAEELKREEIKKSTPESDLSKVKIRHILIQRIKKCGVKRVVSYLLVAIIFFCGGFLADRFIVRHKVGRGFYGNPGIQRGIPGDFKDGRKFRNFGNKNNQQPPANSGAPQNQNQGAPTDGQKQ